MSNSSPLPLTSYQRLYIIIYNIMVTNTSSSGVEIRDSVGRVGHQMFKRGVLLSFVTREDLDNKIWKSNENVADFIDLSSNKLYCELKIAINYIAQ